MATTNRREHVRFRYGMCLNDTCPKCQAKEIQEISARKEFVCAECGKQLRECPPPRSWWDKNGKKTIAAAAVVVIAGGVIAGLSLSGGDKAPVQPEKVVTADTVVSKPVPADTAGMASDTVPVMEKEAQKEPQEKKEKTADKPVKPKAVRNGYGTISLGYGRYTGELKNGKPHGHGTITYTSSHQIVSSKDFIATPGDRFEGEFRDGRISSMGIWYHDGNQTAVKP